MRVEDAHGIARRFLRRSLPVGALVLGMAMLTGCGDTGDDFKAVTPSSTPAFPAVHETTAVVNARACFDATGSTSEVDPQFGPAMRADLAAAVRSWAHNAPADTTGTSPVAPAGAAGQPGLDLRLRWVSTDPFGDMNVLAVAVHPVPGLAPEPAVTASGFAADDVTWQTGATQVTKAAAAAVADAAEAASRISSYPWPDGNSGISACISALIQDLPAGQDVLIVASDGEENEPPQVAGNLHHAKVLWVMPCPSGDAAHCGALQANWRRFLANVGAASVSFIRPESASATLFAQFMKGT